MNKEEALKLIGENDTADWHVVPTEDHNTFLTNYKETEVSKGIKEHVSGVYQKYDDMIKEITGETKPVDVKTHEFLRTSLTALKNDIQGKETKIGDLERAVGDKSGDEAMTLLKSDYKALQTKHQRTLDDFKVEKETLVQEKTRGSLMNKADHALMGIKFLGTVPVDAQKALIEIAKNDVVKDASFLDGNVVFLDATGDPLRDDQLNVITMETRLKDKLKSIIDEGHKQKGVDIKDPVTKDKDGKPIVNVIVPDTVTTMATLIEHLQIAGLVRGEDDYFAALKHWSEKLDIK